MIYHNDDFIEIEFSKYPAVIVSCNDLNNEIYQVSIVEYEGDYMNIKKDNIKKKLSLTNHNKLSILSMFGDWFYEDHKRLFQSLIIENIDITPTEKNLLLLQVNLF